MNTDPIAKVVLAISTIEGLATDPGWTELQKEISHRRDTEDTTEHHPSTDKRSRLFHGHGGDDGEQRGDHLMESELHAVAQEAMTLCGRIVLSLAKRNGVAIPSRAGVYFGVE